MARRARGRAMNRVNHPASPLPRQRRVPIVPVADIGWLLRN
jgi:hypothetical protein